MPQGQNDFLHANVDQTVQIDKPKDTIVEREPIVQTLPENILTIRDIVQHLKHKYKKYGKELLHKFSDFNDLKFDKNGLISIDDNTIPGNIGKKCKSLHSLKNFLFTGSSVFEVLPITIYSIGQKNIAGLQSWLNLLKKHGLMEYITRLNTHSVHAAGMTPRSIKKPQTNPRNSKEP